MSNSVKIRLALVALSALWIIFYVVSCIFAAYYGDCVCYNWICTNGLPIIIPLSFIVWLSYGIVKEFDEGREDRIRESNLRNKMIKY